MSIKNSLVFSKKNQIGGFDIQSILFDQTQHRPPITIPSKSVFTDTEKLIIPIGLLSLKEDLTTCLKPASSPSNDVIADTFFEKIQNIYKKN